jgi:hypothetical protein
MAVRTSFTSGEVLTAADLTDTFESKRDITDGFAFKETVYFTSSGTFTKADYPGLRAIRVRMVGGGGGSGGVVATGAGQSCTSESGGPASYAERFILASLLAASETVTVGAGGSAGAAGANNGATGGSSSFASGKAFQVVATGGGLGRTTSVISSFPSEACGAAFASAAGSVGDFVIQGTGASATINVGSNRAVVAAVPPGVFSAGISGNIGQNNTLPAVAGALYGGGARGVGIRANQAADAGAAGGAGIVIVELYS